MRGYAASTDHLDQHPPSAEDYLRVLRSLWPKRVRSAARDRWILRVQLEHRGWITAGQLARALGYAGHGGANFQMGNLGGAVAAELGIEARSCKYGGINLTFSTKGKDGFIWKMRPTFREALAAFEETRDLLDGAPEPRTDKDVEEQREVSSREGQTREAVRKVRLRDGRMRDQVLNQKEGEGRLWCESCSLGSGPLPSPLADLPLRALLDVHHVIPLNHGERLSQPSHFEVLCPTCHRAETIRDRLG